MELRVVFSIFACVVFFRGSAGVTLTCMTENGGRTCNGASYCQSQWVWTNGMYKMIYGVCIQSSYQIPTGWKFTSQGALEYTCNSGNLCNSAAPPNQHPPPSQPPLITCMRGTGSGPTSYCAGNVCTITQGLGGLSAQCDTSNTVTQQLAIAPHHYCTSTSMGTGTAAYVRYACYCNNVPNCNNDNLLNAGVIQLRKLVSVNCYSGSTANVVQGQYCMSTVTLSNNQVTTVQLSAAATTLFPPTMGCQTIYGYLRGSFTTTCFCNTHFCNVPPPIPSSTRPPITMPFTGISGSSSLISCQTLVIMLLATVLALIVM